MRQLTTAEVRFDEHKAASLGSGAEHLAVLAVDESAAIEFRCRGPPSDGRSSPTGRESGECRLKFGEDGSMHRSRASPAMLNGIDTLFQILHGQSAGPTET